MNHFKKYRNKNYVQVYNDENNKPQFALLAFYGNAKNEIIKRFKETYKLEGDYLKNDGKLSPNCMRSLLVSGGASLGISAATSDTFFMATTNPATLMTIGNGVGSAVMGADGIVAQAPFIPVAGALMPIVAPLVAFQALTAIQSLQQFEKIHKRLISIEKGVNKIIQRTEATQIGEVISAEERLQSIEDEFAISNYFSRDMISRLALVESQINSNLERYKYLYEIQNIAKDSLESKKTDTLITLILSILYLRMDIVRVKVILQENSGYIRAFSKKLVETASIYKNFWNELENMPIQIEAVTDNLKKTVDDMNWWQRNMPEWMFGKTLKKEFSKKNGKAY